MNDRAPWIRPGFGSCLSHSRAGSARNVISIATVNHYSVHELIDWMMMNAPIMQQSRVWGRCSILYLNAHLPLFVAFVLFVALLLFLCTALRKCLWLFVPVRSLAINAKLMFHTCWSFSERVKNSLDHIRTQRVCVCVLMYKCNFAQVPAKIAKTLCKPIVFFMLLLLLLLFLL